LQNIDWRQAGFDWAIWGEEPLYQPRLGKAIKTGKKKGEWKPSIEEIGFDAGIEAGRQILAAIGWGPGLRECLRSTEQRQRKSRELHAQIVKNIELQRLPRRDTEKALELAKPEPCTVCRNIALCAVTSRTCSRFRFYASRSGTTKGVNRVPDKTWDRSFPLSKREREEETKTAAPGPILPALPVRADLRAKNELRRQLRTQLGIGGK
jgi:hypothetical protein